MRINIKFSFLDRFRKLGHGTHHPSVEQLKAYQAIAQACLAQNRTPAGCAILRYMLWHNPGDLSAWELNRQMLLKAEHYPVSRLQKWAYWCVYGTMPLWDRYVFGFLLEPRKWCLTWIIRLLGSPVLRVQLAGYLALAFMARNSRYTKVANWAFIHVQHIAEVEPNLPLRDAINVMRLYKYFKEFSALGVLAYQVLARHPYCAEAVEMLDLSLKVFMSAVTKY
jgi:hypothetical protein